MVSQVPILDIRVGPYLGAYIKGWGRMRGKKREVERYRKGLCKRGEEKGEKQRGRKG